MISLAPRRDQRDLAGRDDDELMTLAAADHEPAMEEIVGRYQRRVRSYCRKWDNERGDDIAQDVFLHLWRSRNSYQPQGQFAVFLFTIVRNRCRTVRRGWFRRPSHVSIDAVDLEQQDGSQLDAMIRAEQTQRLTAAIATLSPKLKEAALLRFSEELSYAEIAKIVGTNEGTARSRVHLAVAQMRHKLTPLRRPLGHGRFGENP